MKFRIYLTNNSTYLIINQKEKAIILSKIDFILFFQFRVIKFLRLFFISLLLAYFKLIYSIYLIINCKI
jgi:hypothetical protein